jgi:hypothetical protein
LTLSPYHSQTNLHQKKEIPGYANVSVSEKEETNKSSLSLSIFKANKDFPATMPLASDKHTGSSQIPSSNFIPALFFYGFSILASSMILSLVLSIFIMLGVESSDNVKAKI